MEFKNNLQTKPKKYLTVPDWEYVQGNTIPFQLFKAIAQAYAFVYPEIILP